MIITNQIKSEFDASKRGNFMEFVLRNGRELFIYRYAIINFINTNLSSRYRRSAIGFFWSLLNPLFIMIIMAVVFSSLYKLPFTDFSMYLFSGLLPWNLVTSSLVGGGMSIISNEGYLKKIYIPKLLFPIVVLGVELVNFLLSLISLFVLILIFGGDFGWSILLLPFALLLLSLFVFGLILILSIVTVFFRDMSHILQIALLGLLYLTPIMYPVSMLSGTLLEIVKFNPFYYFINLFHLIIYDALPPTLNDWLLCILFAIISLSIGVFVFLRRENDVIYRL